MINNFKSNIFINEYTRLLLNSPLHCHRCFIDLMGNLSGGFFLSQIYNWWIYKQGDWNYKFNKDLEKELGLTLWEIRKAKEKAIELNIIEFELRRVGDITNIPFYKINENKLFSLLQEIAEKNPDYIQNTKMSHTDMVLMNYQYHAQEISGGSSENRKRVMCNPHNDIITDITTDITTIKKNIKKKNFAFDEIFEFWKLVFKTPKSKADSARQKKVEERLKDGYTVEELKKAIVGCAVDPWHAQNSVYELKYICRDASIVDKLISKFPAKWKLENSLESLSSGTTNLKKDKIAFLGVEDL